MTLKKKCEGFMHQIIILILFILMTVTSSMAHQHIRPGLWEITTRSDLLALVPHIPSEQMQQLHDLASRYGFKLPKIENGAAAAKICITPEMAKQEIPVYFYENRSGCTVQNATRKGNNYQLELVCSNQYFQGDGVAQGTFTSPESFSGNTEFDSTVGGTPMHATAETQGRWIGEHCTAINPLTVR